MDRRRQAEVKTNLTLFYGGLRHLDVVDSECRVTARGLEGGRARRATRLLGNYGSEWPNEQAGCAARPPSTVNLAVLLHNPPFRPAGPKPPNSVPRS